MPRSASLRNYFEELPRDLTGDYIRQVLCPQRKGDEGNEILLTILESVYLVDLTTHDLYS